MLGGRSGKIAIFCGVAALCLPGVALADSAPHVDTSKPTPVVYPTAAQSAGEEGAVVLKVYVTPFGKAERISILKSSGFADLDNAAIDTVANWRYVPAVRGGDTVPDWATVQVLYKVPQQAANPAK